MASSLVDPMAFLLVDPMASSLINSQVSFFRIPSVTSPAPLGLYHPLSKLEISILVVQVGWLALLGANITKQV